MKARIAAIGIGFAVLLSAVWYAATFTTQAAPPAPQGKPIVGYVVNVGDYLTGGEGKVSKQEAMDLVERGQLLGIVAGKTLYLVFHSDGSFAAKKLAKMAGFKVGVVGKVVKRYGASAIVADLIEVIR